MRIWKHQSKALDFSSLRFKFGAFRSPKTYSWNTMFSWSRWQGCALCAYDSPCSPVCSLYKLPTSRNIPTHQCSPTHFIHPDESSWSKNCTAKWLTEKPQAIRTSSRNTSHILKRSKLLDSSHKLAVILNSNPLLHTSDHGPTNTGEFIPTF